MMALSQGGTRPTTWPRWLGAATTAAGLALALGACARSGVDDVKPTATTAYHSGEAGAPQPAPSTAPAPTRE
ncbi:hypothetical protein [Trinickia diaoshuihuensis]|jgi:hypothetical protein|uniref:hypothetical protein n=1 Tax=Trinickia diaoshuihuensis TaxID=2292265 RepID=UPI0013C2BA42|nr:hypothetical protein [Trinickia diaoshuihuensis]